MFYVLYTAWAIAKQVKGRRRSSQVADRYQEDE